MTGRKFMDERAEEPLEREYMESRPGTRGCRLQGARASASSHVRVSFKRTVARVCFSPVICQAAGNCPITVLNSCLTNTVKGCIDDLVTRRGFRPPMFYSPFFVLPHEYELYTIMHVTIAPDEMSRFYYFYSKCNRVKFILREK